MLSPGTRIGSYEVTASTELFQTTVVTSGLVDHWIPRNDK